MTTRKLAYAFLVLLLIVLLSVWALHFFTMKPPKEGELIQSFQQHRVAYERLRSMFLEDKQLNRVYVDEGVGTPDSLVLRKPSEINFPIGRYNEYVSLLREIGSNAVFKNTDHNSDSVCIGVWGAGWAGHARHVWICSIQHPPNQVASLDVYYRDRDRPRDVFRCIENDWYLRADW